MRAPRRVPAGTGQSDGDGQEAERALEGPTRYERLGSLLLPATSARKDDMLMCVWHSPLAAGAGGRAAPY